MKFIIDNQLPVALAAFIRSKGIEAKHVFELGLDKASDREIWELAKKDQCILISKDEDFFHLIKQQPNAQLVWVRIGNCRTHVLLAAFEKLWSTLEDGLKAGEHVIEVR